MSPKAYASTLGGQQQAAEAACVNACQQRQTNVQSLIDALDVLAQRLHVVSLRQGDAVSRFFGTPSGPVVNDETQSPGLIGVVAEKITLLQRIATSLEDTTSRIEEIV